MKTRKNPELFSPQKCQWCKDGEVTPNSPCPACGHPTGVLPKVDWGQIEKVFPDGQVPSCGMTDAARMNSDGNNIPPTIYIGAKPNSR